MLPLLTGVSHLMGLSQIKALKEYVEGMVVYGALIAEPATGKSPALNIIRKALVEIENFLAIPSESSKLVNGYFSFFSFLSLVCFFKSVLFHYSRNRRSSYFISRKISNHNKFVG